MLLITRHFPRRVDLPILDTSLIPRSEGPPVEEGLSVHNEHLDTSPSVETRHIVNKMKTLYIDCFI